MKISKQNRKGFTLVELLVVIAILGILAAIAIPRFSDASATARGAKVVADLRTIDSAIAMYNAQYGSYPTDAANVDSLITAGLLAGKPQPPTTGTKYTINSVDYTKTAAYAIGTNTATTNSVATKSRALLNTYAVEQYIAGEAANSK